MRALRARQQKPKPIPQCINIFVQNYLLNYIYICTRKNQLLANPQYSTIKSIYAIESNKPKKKKPQMIQMTAGRQNIKPGDILAHKAYKDRALYKSPPYPEPSATPSPPPPTMVEHSSAITQTVLPLNNSSKNVPSSLSSLSANQFYCPNNATNNVLMSAATCGSTAAAVSACILDKHASVNVQPTGQPQQHLPNRSHPQATHTKSTNSNTSNQSSRKQNRRIGRQESRYTSGK